MSNDFTIDQTRWRNLDIFNQMGNIYSEVGRSFTAKNRGNVEDQWEAVIRALDLFNATVEALIARRSAKVKEVLRAKEQYLEALYNPQVSPASIQSLDRYFMQFAIAARRNR